MITALTGVNDALVSNYPNANMLVNFTLGDSNWYLSDSNKQVTVGGGVYRPANGVIGNISLPAETEEISSLDCTIELVDVGRIWRSRFQEFLKLTVRVLLVFNAGLANQSTPFSLYFGSCSGVEFSSSESDPYIILLSFTGPIANVDAAFLSVTSDENQRTRDPGDSAFETVGRLRDFSWGNR